MEAPLLNIFLLSETEKYAKKSALNTDKKSVNKTKSGKAKTSANWLPLLFKSSLVLVVLSLLTSIYAQADASGLQNRVIRSGPNAGRRLVEVVSAYRAGGIRIPQRVIQDSFSFYDRYRHCNRIVPSTGLVPRQGLPSPVLENQRYMVIFDLDQNSSQRRLHLLDLETGEIRSTEAAHGIGSDCGGGRACRFQNFEAENSDSSPLGFFATGPVTEFYARDTLPKPGSVTLYGLETPTSGGFTGNSNTSSGLIIHGAAYVGSGRAGRSHGCPALSQGVLDAWRPQLQGGALFYFYSSQLDSLARNQNVAGLSPGCTNEARVATPAVSSASGTCPPGVPIGTVCQRWEEDSQSKQRGGNAR